MSDLDIDNWEAFFAPNASFHSSTMAAKTTLPLAEEKENMEKLFANTKEMKIIILLPPFLLPPLLPPAD